MRFRNWRCDCDWIELGKLIRDGCVLVLTDGIFVRKGELKSVCLVFVERVVVEDFDVHLPFLQSIGLDDGDTRREVLIHLGKCE